MPKRNSDNSEFPVYTVSIGIKTTDKLANAQMLIKAMKASLDSNFADATITIKDQRSMTAIPGGDILIELEVNLISPDPIKVVSNV